jgi:glycosyltransferase involved in cell wall biosynthesis
MHVVLSLDPGGTERLVIEICKRLSPAVRSMVCCLDHAGAWAAELTPYDIPVKALGRLAGFDHRLPAALAAAARANHIDLLHCHHYTPFVYGQLAALVTGGLPVIFTEHGRLSDDGPSLKRRMVNPLLGRLPSAIFAVSEDLRRHMVAEGLPAQRVRVIHNGVEAAGPPQAADRRAARQRLGIGHDRFVIGAVGRFDPVKDFETLLDGFAASRRLQPGATLVLVGDGPERPRIEARIASLGLQETVLLLGYRADVRRILPAFDVFANSSTHEGVSLTILEAMAAALPVVATRVGGTPEVVRSGETGLLVPGRTSSAFAEAFGTLAADPDRRQAFGAAGRVRMQRHFSFASMAAGYLDAYVTALSDR